MAENVNNKYYIKLEAVTPLSVGAGNEEEWVKCADYVIHGGKVYLLDLSKIAEHNISLDQLSFLLVNQDHDGIVRLLGNKLPEVSRRVFLAPCATDNNIKAFERSQMHDMPVVAGSSLKGALRSVLFKYLRDNESTNDEVFGKMKDGSDFMRFIKVGDFEMEDTSLFNSKIFNLHLVDGEWCGGWKHALQNGTDDRFRSTGFNTLYECIAPGVGGVGSVMMSLEQFSKVIQKGTPMSHSTKKQHLLEGGLRSLFAIVNNYTRDYLAKERAFFVKYHADRTDQIIHCIDELLASIPVDNSSCLIKMSAGVGFHAITGDWQYEDYSATGVHEFGRNMGKQKYKSRKIVETAVGLKLMGFVRLAEIPEEDYKEDLKSIEDSFNAVMRSKVEQRAAKEAERLAAEQEKKDKMDNYLRLVTEAEEAESHGDYRLSKSKAEEASSLFPEKQDPKDIIARVTLLAIQQEASDKQRDAANLANGPFDEDIAKVKDFVQMKGRCKNRKPEFCTPEGKSIVEQWLEKYFCTLSPREKRNFQKPKKWMETFGDCYDEATLLQWIEKYSH